MFVSLLHLNWLTGFHEIWNTYMANICKGFRLFQISIKCHLYMKSLYFKKWKLFFLCRTQVKPTFSKFCHKGSTNVEDSYSLFQILFVLHHHMLCQFFLIKFRHLYIFFHILCGNNVANIKRKNEDLLICLFLSHDLTGEPILKKFGTNKISRMFNNHMLFLFF